jgi:hypothetical protein
VSDRRCCGTITGTVVPAAILALLPKCPACLVAWLAVAGLGVTVSTATALRIGLLVSCVACLAYMWRSLVSAALKAFQAFLQGMDNGLPLRSDRQSRVSHRPRAPV